MLRILWGYGRPGGPDVTTSATAPDGWVPVERLLAMPSSRASKFLVSDAPARPAQRLLTSYNAIRMRRTAWQRRALGLYLRSGLPRGPVGDSVTLVARTGQASAENLAAVSFPAHLRALIGDPDALLAVGIRQLDDHHAKPTFQLFTSGGEPEAYAKLGWSRPTAPLVRHESEVLQRLEKQGLPTGVLASRPTHIGDWDGHPYLVMEPLPADVRSLTSWDSPRWASRALAGRTWRSPLLESPWHQELLRRLRSLDRTSSEIAEAAHRAAAVVASRAARSEARSNVEFGAWHGDWTWWNLAQSSAGLHVWDWEHSEEAAPLGFDDLHWSISVDLKLRRIPLHEAVVRARQQLSEQGQADPDLFLLAYLAEMAVRTCEVSLHGPGSPVELHAGLLEELRALTHAHA